MTKRKEKSRTRKNTYQLATSAPPLAPPRIAVAARVGLVPPHPASPVDTLVGKETIGKEEK